MNLFRKFIYPAMIIGLFCSFTATANTAAPHSLKPTVILVHGAFADGSSWSKVIHILQKEGIKTVAVQNPLTSLNADVTATQNAISQAQRPVVLVGHSWAGMVITQAGIDPKVKALVYVAAFAPDKSENIINLEKIGPKNKFKPQIEKDNQNFLSLTEKSVEQDFAGDIPPDQADVLAAIQGHWAAATLSQPVTAVAWKQKPSWDIITQNDHMISPALQEIMASRINAHILRLPSSHVAMISHPEAVAAEIMDAVNAVQAAQ
ncbi:alpha/beta hydrolase [Swingsia samuiensis]|uniref:Alpha/beta hydrolase n=1 Tax=Swingsia samuiensis TaxID=1293412 RepID=A0A4Y6UKU4_9PROT|nr:alpha/beta hydrolase [Swingsia samuiensis]QDH17021.1 alpha/beta hydrolase [Swingsia samuiensis]